MLLLVELNLTLRPYQFIYEKTWKKQEYMETQKEMRRDHEIWQKSSKFKYQKEHKKQKYMIMN